MTNQTTMEVKLGGQAVRKSDRLRTKQLYKEFRKRAAAYSHTEKNRSKNQNTSFEVVDPPPADQVEFLRYLDLNPKQAALRNSSIAKSAPAEFFQNMKDFKDRRITIDEHTKRYLQWNKSKLRSKSKLHPAKQDGPAHDHRVIQQKSNIKLSSILRTKLKNYSDDRTNNIEIQRQLPRSTDKLPEKSKFENDKVAPTLPKLQRMPVQVVEVPLCLENLEWIPKYNIFPSPGPVKREFKRAKQFPFIGLAPPNQQVKNKWAHWSVEEIRSLLAKWDTEITCISG